MKPDIKVLLIGVVALLIFAAYSFSDFTVSKGGGELRKADFASLYRSEGIAGTTPLFPDADATDPGTVVTEPDTAQNILFIGDSMLEGLCRRFIDYTEHNGHTLHTVIWYSSTSDLWANTDTLQYFMKKYDPSYVVICLCSNELFVKDLDRRRADIAKIIDKLHGLPFVWISPPNWKDDTGINEVILSSVGKRRYFDSRNLTLERGKDHAHPTFAAAEIWMDTIARWMKSTDCRNPIRMDCPDKDVSPKNITILQPYYK